MARRLLKLEIDRVDLVDRGGNQKAHVVLTKSLVKKDGPSVGSVHVDTAGCECSDCVAAVKSKEKRMNAKEMLKNFVTFLKTSGAEGAEEIAKDMEMTDEEKAKEKAKAKENEEAEAKKRLDSESVAKRMTELEKRATDAETLAKSERNLRLDSEMRDVLKSFKATPFNLDDAKEDNDIRKFRKMQDADPDGFKRVLDLMKAQDAQMATSEAFKSIGKNGSGAVGSAEAQLVAKAAEIRKNDTKLTEESAFAAACEQNPGLTRQYRQEQH